MRRFLAEDIEVRKWRPRDVVRPFRVVCCSHLGTTTTLWRKSKIKMVFELTELSILFSSFRNNLISLSCLFRGNTLWTLNDSIERLRGRKRTF